MTDLTQRFSVKVWVYGIGPLASTYIPSGFSISSDALVLGGSNISSKIGVAAPNNRRLRSDMAPRDISPFVESLTITRGRQRGLDSFEGGTATLVIDDTTRAFDPLNTGGWTGSHGGSKNLFRKGRAVRILLEGTADSGTNIRFCLFSGFVDTVSVAYGSMANTLSTTTVQCVDAFALAAAVDGDEAAEAYGDGETMGPRVRRWAAAAGVMQEADPLAARGLRYYTTYSSGIQTQPSTILTGWRYGVCGDEGTATLQSTSLAENALTAMKVAAASEDGRLFVNKDGQIVHQARASRSVQWTFSDTLVTPSSTTYASGSLDIGADSITVNAYTSMEWDGWPTITADTRDVANVVSLARAGGAARIAVDDTADEIGRVGYSRTDLINDNDTDVDAIAAAIVSRHGFSTHKVIVSGLTIHPGLNDRALWFMCTGELTQAVRFYSTALSVDKTMYVSGISFSCPKEGLVASTATLTLTETD